MQNPKTCQVLSAVENNEPRKEAAMHRRWNWLAAGRNLVNHTFGAALDADALSLFWSDTSWTAKLSNSATGPVNVHENSNTACLNSDCVHNTRSHA